MTSNFKILFSVFVLMILAWMPSIHANTRRPQACVEATIHERLFSLSSYYEVASYNGPQGTLIKESLTLQTSYQFYDLKGGLLSSAYRRILSLGSLFTCAGVLDVYDQEGERLGWIEGTLLTFLPSEFSFYNADRDLIGIAYMDHDCMGFTLSDPANERKIIAHFRRKFIKDITDHWVIMINDPEVIDYRLLYTFGAFAVDNQSYFRTDD